MAEKNASSLLFKISGILFVTVFTVITVYPLLQTLMISFKSIEEFTKDPLGLITVFRPYNYIEAWIKADCGTLFLNTIIVTVITILLVIFLGSPAGYTLSKVRVKGEKLIYNYFLLGIIIPFQAIMIPLLQFANQTHMTNKLTALIVIYLGTNLSFPILLYTGFYKGIPYEIIEAAMIDGCNIIQLFGKIIFPMTTSINLTVAIFVGMNTWRDFSVPLVFTNDKIKRTLSIGLYNFQSSYFTNWTLIFAMVVLMSLPLILLYLFSQRAFISGIVDGAIKG